MTRSNLIAAGIGWAVGFASNVIAGGSPVWSAIGATLGVLAFLVVVRLLQRGAR